MCRGRMYTPYRRKTNWYIRSTSDPGVRLQSARSYCWKPFPATQVRETARRADAAGSSTLETR